MARYLSEDFYQQLVELVGRERAGQFDPEPSPPPSQASPGGQVVMMLQDLETGSTAKALPLQRDNNGYQLQLITLYGTLSLIDTTGTFTVQANAADGTEEESDPIAWTATAADFAAACQSLSILKQRKATYALGTQVEQIDSQRSLTRYYIGRWLIRSEPPQIPLVTIDNGLSGNNYFRVETTNIRPLRAYVEVTAATPLPSPTPIRTGAILTVEQFGNFGLCPPGVEPRRYDAGA